MQPPFSKAGLSPEHVSAITRFEAGLYDMAASEFTKLLTHDPRDALARHFLLLAQRRLFPRPSARPTLVWQFNPDAAWERDWLRQLLGGAIAGEQVDNAWSHISDPMIVVDNRLVADKAVYYQRAFEQGARIVLVHLSDESFRDDYGIYKYCEAVIRNYHSELLAESTRVLFIPLGCKAGFVKPDHPLKPAGQRKHVWSFAGDMKKYTRGEMLAAMGEVAPGFTHLTEGFNTRDCLAIDDYRALLDETIFVPCPGGWSNLETFRVYEALEAGCIPIVEQRPGFDYFMHLLGSHPIPTITRWAEAIDLVRHMHKEDRIAHTQDICIAWWRDYKSRLEERVADFVGAALT